VPAGDDPSAYKFVGSTLVVLATDKEDVLSQLAGDIYNENGVWDLEKVGAPSVVCHCNITSEADNVFRLEGSDVAPEDGLPKSIRGVRSYSHKHAGIVSRGDECLLHARLHPLLLFKQPETVDSNSMMNPRSDETPNPFRWRRRGKASCPLPYPQPPLPSCPTPPEDP